MHASVFSCLLRNRVLFFQVHVMRPFAKLSAQNADIWRVLFSGMTERTADADLPSLVLRVVLAYSHARPVAMFPDRPGAAARINH